MSTQTQPPFAAVTSSGRPTLSRLLTLLGVLLLWITATFDYLFARPTLIDGISGVGLADYTQQLIHGLWLVHNVHLFGLGLLALLGTFFTASIRPWLLLFAGTLATVTGLALMAAVGTTEATLLPILGGLVLGAGALVSYQGR